jgi:hypothetical protein
LPAHFVLRRGERVNNARSAVARLVSPHFTLESSKRTVTSSPPGRSTRCLT